MNLTADQIDKIKGVFYGQAIGDALGLGTEFLNKQEIKEYYPNGFSDYSQIVQDRHRIRWQKGAWTDDTDQFLCIYDSIMNTGKVDELAFAEELYKWFEDEPMGIGQTVYKVLTMPQFLEFPHKAAKLIWKMSNRKSAANGALMRNSILGTYQFQNIDEVIANSEKIARVTHWDERCVGSCVIQSVIIAKLIQSNQILNIDEILEIGDQYDPRIREYLEHNLTDNIESLSLDDKDSMGYTLKALGAGLWAYFYAQDFESGVLTIINEGGDADTNACIAGSILGAKFGQKAIPQKYINGLYKMDYFHKIVMSFIFNKS